MSKQPKKPAGPDNTRKRTAAGAAGGPEKKGRPSGGGGLLELNSIGTPLLRRENCPWWERVSQIFALVLLTLFPLVMSTKTYSNITKTRFDAFVRLTVDYALLCLFILLVFPFGQGNRRRTPPPQRPTLPQLFLAGYMVWAAISALASRYTGLWQGQSRYEGLFSLLLYGTVFLLLSFWGEYTDGYVYGLAALGGVMGLLGLIQSTGSHLLYPYGYYYWNSLFLSTAGNVDCLAGYLCMLLPLLVCGFVLLESRWRYLCLPGVFLLTYLLLFSESDTGKMGLAVVVLLLPFLLDDRRHAGRTLMALGVMALGAALQKLLTFTPYGPLDNHGMAPSVTCTVDAGGRFPVLLAAGVVLAAAGWLLGRMKWELPVKKRTMRMVWAAAVALAIAAALVCVYGYSGGSATLAEASALLHGRMSDEMGTCRGYIWKHTWELVQLRPVLGHGPGSFQEAFAPYNAGYQALMGEGITVDFAHNDFLHIACSEGLVGLALYLGFLGTLLWRILRRAGRSPMLVILLAGVLGFLVYAFFVFSLAIVSPVFWALAGLADKCCRQSTVDSDIADSTRLSSPGH